MNYLYIVATPIGNLKDLSFRAVDILKNVDVIASENPSKSKKLLSEYNINKNMIKYNEGNKDFAVKKIIKKLNKDKDIAYISEAGTPTISDPGYLLINEALKYKNIKVVPIPGASALTTLLMASGLNIDEFLFMGFLPKKDKQIKDFLKKINIRNITTAIYVSPYKIEKFFKYSQEILENRYIVVGREMTKKYEEITRGNIKDIENKVLSNIKGEYTIIIKNKDESKDSKTSNILDDGMKLLKSYSISESAKILSKLYPENKSTIYNILQKNLKS